MTEKEIKHIVSMTVDDMIDKKYAHMGNDDFNYHFMSMKLRQHYEVKEIERIANGLQVISNDPYFKIIPMYYQKNKTITAIAIDLVCDRATVSRNKKKLVLELFRLCYSD